MAHKMCPVVHFEMPANDRNRMAKFYNDTFGWKTEMLGSEMGNYVVVKTAEHGPNGIPKEPGRINGGFYPKGEHMETQYPSIVIAVEDIQKSIVEVKEAGGKVLGEPMDIPGVGKFVPFIDTEGNKVSMLQPNPM